MYTKENPYDLSHPRKGLRGLANIEREKQEQPKNYPDSPYDLSKLNRQKPSGRLEKKVNSK